MKNQRIRTRNPQPILSDSEVLTMEVIGSFLGIDTNKGFYTFFRRHYREWFPALLSIHRTTFTRQMANLWMVKEKIWHHVLNYLHFDSQISVIDSFPVPICRFARANRWRCLRDVAAYERDENARQTFLGLRAHLRICWPGVIVDFRLAPANIHGLDVAKEMFTHVKGWALGDSNYWSLKMREELLAQGLSLLTPFKKASRETNPWLIWLKHMRYRIEIVIGQLVERFHAKRTWARDAWHLYSRWLGKILSHTLAAFFCQNINLFFLVCDLV